MIDKRFIEQCERERLHLSGSIQACGAMLVVDAKARVSHASANVAEFLGAPPSAWLGRPLPEDIAHVAAMLPASPAGFRHPSELAMPGPAGGAALLDVTAIRGMAGQAILEFTRAGGPDEAYRAGPRFELHRFANDEAVTEARGRLVEEVARLSGAHRVMYYQFKDDGDGEVIAEAREESHYGSYLGLRFPASDIPQVARALYLKNPWRLIHDAEALPVPLLGTDALPPDLTWSDLRSASPIHCVYLANMGVRCSLSFPIILGGMLSALVAVHHREPLHSPRRLLDAMSRMVNQFSLSLANFNAQRRMHLVDNLARRFDPMREAVRRHGDMFSAWPELASWLLHEFRADGALLCRDDEVVYHGTTFEAGTLDLIDDWFCTRQDELVRASDHLSQHVPGYPMSQIAGTLALRTHSAGRSGIRIYLTRCEHVHEVAWGGNPEKPVEAHDGLYGIAPRRSFEKWIEKRLGYSSPWSNEAKLLALRLRDLLLNELR